MELTTIFYHIDEFCKVLEKEHKNNVLTNGKNIRNRAICLTLSEVMTILTYYHVSGFKTFKDFYMRSKELRLAFPKMPSYNRFLELQNKATIPLSLFLKIITDNSCDGISFIDSFSLKVCHPKRIHSHKVFAGLASRGKTSVGWFFGFKLHLVINAYGEIISFLVTPGNVTDNNSNLIEAITENVYGKVYGDKGYLLKKDLFATLLSRGVHLVTKIRKNMKNVLMTLSDKILLKKRGVIESVGAILKESYNIEHSRYRNSMTLFMNVSAGLVAYIFRQNKPSIRF